MGRGRSSVAVGGCCGSRMHRSRARWGTRSHALLTLRERIVRDRPRTLWNLGPRPSSCIAMSRLSAALIVLAVARRPSRRGRGDAERRPRTGHRVGSPGRTRSTDVVGNDVLGAAAARIASTAARGDDRLRRRRRQRPPRRRGRQRPRSPATPGATRSSAAAATTPCSAARATTASAGAPGDAQDVIVGGNGNDTINARDGAARPDLAAGRGRDTRAWPTRATRSAATASASGVAEAAPARGPGRPVVLLVDDDAAIRRTVARPRARGVRRRARLGRPRGARGRRRASQPAVDPARPHACPTSTASRSSRGCARRGDDVPVCVLSARDEVADRVRGPGGRRRRLRRQAVRARGGRRAAARAAAPPPAPTDERARGRRPASSTRAARTARRGGRELELTRREFELLAALRAPPRRGPRPRAACTRRSGATPSIRAPTSPTSSSATCAASSRPTASRACCTRCAASASSCDPERPMRSLRGRLTLGVTLAARGGARRRGRDRSHEIDRSERAGARRPAAAHGRALARDRGGRGPAGAARRRPPPRRRAAGDRAARCACCVGDTVLLDAGVAADPHARGCPGAVDTSRSAGTRYRAYVDDAARPRPRRPRAARGRLRASRGSRTARPRSTAASRLLGLATAARGRRRGLARGRPRPAPAARLRRGGLGSRPRTRTSSAACRPTAARPSCARWRRASTRCSRGSARSAARPRARARRDPRRFAADAGHELRTPLTSVQATLSALAPPSRPAGRAPRGDGRRRAGRAAAPGRAPRRAAGARARRRGSRSSTPTVDLAEVVDAAWPPRSPAPPGHGR